MTEEKNDGFKIVVALLTAFGSILYVLNNFYQNNAINSPYLYFFIKLIISVGITSSLLFIVYILIKGISIGIKSENDFWEESASFIYLFTFSALIAFTIEQFIEFTTSPNPYPEIYVFIYIIFFLFSFYGIGELSIIRDSWDIMISKLPLAEKIKKLQWQKVQWKKLQSKKVIVLFVFILALHWFYFTYPTDATNFLTNGRITISMDDVYYKKDIEIPAAVKITGWNNGTNITLIQKNYAHLVPIASINLTSGYNQNHNIISENNSLIGNANDKETYTIFINTSKLSVGYYELVVEPWDVYRISSKAFYISQ